ncbi:thiamine pyrophosphate protein central region, partial [Pseudomonas amygdali pv. mori str. 301020]
TFSIPPGRLIHIDIDPHEIGKNYPVAVGIVSDARYALAHTVVELSKDSVDRTEYLADLKKAQDEWETKLAARRDSDRFPFTSQRPLGALRKVFPRDTIVVVGSGNTQGAVKQTFPVYQPRTHLTSGGFSSMGWAVPAAIGAKLAAPNQPVVCILGDGDFLMNSQEIAICKTNDIPVIFIIQNNAGYMSIRGGQRKQTSRHLGSEFTTPDGQSYSPDFEALGNAFGLKSYKVNSNEELEPILQEALDSGVACLIEVPTDRDAAGPWVPGWWDFPVPEYITDERQDEYRQIRATEQHL